MDSRLSVKEDRPGPKISSCPVDRPASAVWGICHFIQELRFKSFHYRPLKISAEDLKKMKDYFSAALLAKMIDKKEDPIGKILQFALSHVLDEASKEHDILYRSWLHNETTLNARLTLACALGGPSFTTHMFSSVLSKEVSEDELGITCLRGKYKGASYYKVFGQPDLLLLSSSCLVMAEMKVRGKSTAQAKYDAIQFLKYLSLAHHAYGNINAKQVVHFILSPRKGSPLFYHHGWIESLNDGDETIKINLKKLSEGKPKGKSLKWLGKRPDMAQIAETLNKVPVHHIYFDQLRDKAREFKSRGPWIDAALWQLEKLVEDAEPMEPHVP